jgi:hypothetical protein
MILGCAIHAAIPLVGSRELPGAVIYDHHHRADLSLSWFAAIAGDDAETADQQV